MSRSNARRFIDQRFKQVVGNEVWPPDKPFAP